jgi:hypothetical protein
VTATLVRRAIRGYITFPIALAVMIFLSAWTLQFWQAWHY